MMEVWQAAASIVLVVVVVVVLLWLVVVIVYAAFTEVPDTHEPSHASHWETSSGH